MASQICDGELRYSAKLTDKIVSKSTFIKSYQKNENN